MLSSLKKKSAFGVVPIAIGDFYITSSTEKQANKRVKSHRKIMPVAVLVKFAGRAESLYAFEVGEFLSSSLSELTKQPLKLYILGI